MATPDQYLDESREQGLKELDAFLRIPSVSADPERADDVRRAAGHLAEQLERVGLENATIIDTAGHPVVYADWLRAPGKPTVLVYGHYDVQPVDPLELWTSPPFEPIQQDGLLLARGSSDDKGQLAMHWQAIEAWLKTTGELPVNLKFIAEGEEEITSVHFEDFVRENLDRLRADYCVVSDTAMVAKDFPRSPTRCVASSISSSASRPRTSTCTPASWVASLQIRFRHWPICWFTSRIQPGTSWCRVSTTAFGR